MKYQFMLVHGTKSLNIEQFCFPFSCDQMKPLSYFKTAILVVAITTLVLHQGSQRNSRTPRWSQFIWGRWRDGTVIVQKSLPSDMWFYNTKCYAETSLWISKYAIYITTCISRRPTGTEHLRDLHTVRCSFNQGRSFLPRCARLHHAVPHWPCYAKLHYAVSASC